MNAVRTRIVPVAVLWLALLMPLSASPANAAGNCALSAPATVKVGDPLDINGSGFPATTSVDVVFKLEGSQGDAFSVESDASGGFQISLTPEESDAGVTTVTATAGSTCAATVTFTVRGTTAPAPTATATATAAPGSSGSAGASAQPRGAPRTDTLSVTAGSSGGPSSIPWLLGVLSIVIGLGGLLATRPARSR
jgi:hypothetical protein